MRSLAILLLPLAFALPPMKRDYTFNSTSTTSNVGDISVQNNVGVNVDASPSGSIGVDVDINDTVTYGDSGVNVDTHLGIDVNGNEVEINSAGVTIKTKINGIWYDSNGQPCASPSINPQPFPNSSTKPYPSYSPTSSLTTPTSSPTTTSTPTSTSTSSSTTSTTSTTSTSTTSPPSPTNFISGEGVYGISYDPFKGTDQSCKTGDEIIADITEIVSYGYSNIRFYGVECNAIDYALSAVGTETKLILGVYTVNNYTAETSDLVNQVANRWSLVEYVSVFNEAVNDGRATVAQVEEAITYVKTQVPTDIPVTTIDTFSAYIANPSLCNVGQDFIGANVQPYFSAVSASDAGAYVVQQQANVAAVCGVSYVELTECGWPAAGQTLGDAVPSKQNQYIAVSSIISATQGSVIVFEAFNDYWKAPGTYGVEQSFGLYTSSSP